MTVQVFLIFEEKIQKREMRPLETNRLLMTWLSLHPASNNTSTAMKSVYMRITVACISSKLSFLLASIVYFWKFVWIDLGMALKAFWAIVIIATLLYSFAVMIFSRQKIEQTYETLSIIYDASM